MKTAKNRERILLASIDLFNQSGVVAITTNHIASHLSISPGNLYFHFRNKEEIVRELFDRMCDATYRVWRSGDKNRPPRTPVELIEQSFDVFWEFRFFHREMYHLRLKDPQLARKWRAHIQKTMRLLKSTYDHWVQDGIMRPISDPKEMEVISDSVLITSSAFMHFLESPEKPVSRKSLKRGIHHIARLLLPYHTDSFRTQMQSFVHA